MEVLQTLAVALPAAGQDPEYRTMGKLKSTYVDALSKAGLLWPPAGFTPPSCNL